MNVTFSSTSITVDEDSQYTLNPNGMMMQYICMLHFKEDILWNGTDTSYTKMPCMPQEPIVADNQECWIGGWGSTAVIGTPSDELRSRGVRLDNGTECQDQAFTSGPKHASMGNGPMVIQFVTSLRLVQMILEAQLFVLWMEKQFWPV
ncbi:Oidioi.mRNA.OKI2018_I69.chr2.g8323.t1.cds [Oikopleura dioica]|uniref:Oidioi.mRNA.OKI2018_I69.chr2.g8323.t1.cds n=1 Tax=Oikopleura dioica TaxID=34765 RepID=A0ABN7T8X4_OIKDI|nr:Oidioi.mRNA.OKI2018_I69.chr2.g8323.t1.cds [Oikopleura dioica]